MIKKFLFFFLLLYVFYPVLPMADDTQGAVITFSGRDIGSPLREGARTIELPLAHYPIDRIEVRWKAKKDQEAEGWLFLDNKEYDWTRSIDQTWKVEYWDNVLTGYESFQLGIARDDDDSQEDQVDIDWVKIFYRTN